MPDFDYIARDSSGQRVSGTLNAGTEQEAIAQLSQKALFPVEVKPLAKGQRFGFGQRIRPGLLATTYSQLADLLRSGVPMLRALQVLERQTNHDRLKEVLIDIRGQVEEGSTLAGAMGRHPQVFSELAVSIVRAGGEGGFLEDALQQVSDFTEKQEDLKSRTLGAIAYPVFLIAIGILVVAGLMIFLVPRFEKLFASLRERGELPALTEGLLMTSTFLQNWGWLVAIGLAAGFVALRTQLATERGRWISDTLRIRLPIAGPIFLNLAVARFCRVLGTLLHNGVPILNSLRISSDSTGNRVLTKAIQEAGENVSSGESLAAPLVACGHFPATVTEMIAVAEESNTLERVLVDIADRLEMRTWRQLELAVRLLEPILLLLLSGVVLVIVLALLLPIVKMSMMVG